MAGGKQKKCTARERGGREKKNCLQQAAPAYISLYPPLPRYVMPGMGWYLLFPPVALYLNLLNTILCVNNAARSGTYICLPTRPPPLAPAWPLAI